MFNSHNSYQTFSWLKHLTSLLNLMTVTPPSTKCSLRNTCKSWPHISVSILVKYFSPSGMVWDDLQEQGEKILSSPMYYFYLNIIDYRNVCFIVFRNGTPGLCFWEGRLMAGDVCWLVGVLVEWVICNWSRNEWLWPCPWKGKWLAEASQFRWWSLGLDL